MDFQFLNLCDNDNKKYPYNSQILEQLKKQTILLKGIISRFLRFLDFRCAFEYEISSLIFFAQFLWNHAHCSADLVVFVVYILPTLEKLLAEHQHQKLRSELFVLFSKYLYLVFLESLWLVFFELM